MLAAALGIMPGQPLPPMIFEGEVASPMEQAQQLLEGAQPDEWIVFDQARGAKGAVCGYSNLLCTPCVEPASFGAHCSAACLLNPGVQVLWPKDMFFGGNRGCRDGADARLMRTLLHAMHGTQLPSPGAAPPATITLQRKSANRRIVNEEEVVAMLREFGEVGRCRLHGWAAWQCIS